MQLIPALHAQLSSLTGVLDSKTKAPETSSSPATLRCAPKPRRKVADSERAGNVVGTRLVPQKPHCLVSSGSTAARRTSAGTLPSLKAVTVEDHCPFHPTEVP